MQFGIEVILTFKVELPSSKKEFLLASMIYSPSKMMKNAFYFILKVLKIFKYLSGLFEHVEKRID